MNGEQMARNLSAGSNGDLRFTIRFGAAAVVLSLLVALVSFLIFAGFTPIAPTSNVLLVLFSRQCSRILLVFCFVLAEAYALFQGASGRGGRSAAAHPDRRAFLYYRRGAGSPDGWSRLGDA